MKIEVTSRHENNSKEIKEYAIEKAGKIFKYFNNIIKVKVILDQEKDNHTAEIIVSVSRGNQLVAEVTHPDMHAAIDLLVDKMERQLVRFKERLKDRRTGKGTAAGKEFHTGGVESFEEEEDRETGEEDEEDEI